jgi:hypothetical protein
MHPSLSLYRYYHWLLGLITLMLLGLITLMLLGLITLMLLSLITQIKLENCFLNLLTFGATIIWQ